jgi:Mrp family chromosome partitioning ATPase
VSDDLTVIPSGDGKRDAVKLLQQLRQHGRASLLAQADELLIVELPSVLATAYGRPAASLVDALVVVVRAGMAPDALVAETCSQLGDLPIQGVALNHAKSRIPRWIRQLL